MLSRNPVITPTVAPSHHPNHPPRLAPINVNSFRIQHPSKSSGMIALRLAMYGYR